MGPSREGEQQKEEGVGEEEEEEEEEEEKQEDGNDTMIEYLRCFFLLCEPAKAHHGCVRRSERQEVVLTYSAINRLAVVLILVQQ